MTEKLVSVSGSNPQKWDEPEKLHAPRAVEIPKRHGLFAVTAVNDLIMKKCLNYYLLIALCLMTVYATAQKPVPSFVPPMQDLHRPFGKADRKMFEKPSPLYYPETLMFFIGGNVSKEGVTADLEAIAAAGISGIQLFHGQMGGPWPGVSNQITCLSPQWDDIITHTAGECRRLGLKFAMHNSPGWAMSGGPWIKPENAMRHLVMSRTDTLVTVSAKVEMKLPRPQPSNEDWRDYRDITVIAFPTPADDTGEPLKPFSVKSSTDFPWKDFLSGNTRKAIKLPPVSGDSTHWIEVTFADAVTLRTVEFSSINGFNHGWCYEPGINVAVQAVLPDGTAREILNVPMPQSSWQDDRPISLACDEIPESDAPVAYRISISNLHDMNLRSLRLYAAARKNNWESEAGWTLRSIVRAGEHPKQSEATFVNPTQVREIAADMDREGNLKWNAPAGKWTVLRIGHVNTGMKNAPAPPEGTGWECDKLNASGAETHFAGYIGRLAEGPLADGLLTGMHLDSWECKTQTWTEGMENAFSESAGYPLLRWLPALFGYVVDSHETSSRFLRDWRGAVNGLFVNKYYGRMAELGHAKGLGITFETAAGDIFPADIMEYYKHCDVPQTEFWQPIDESFVGSINFKPIKPTASAARMYGKPRVGAEAFTSFSLTWDEHLSMLREVASVNCVEGVTHLLFHTYTHNPNVNMPPPGSSFGEAGIGTPFLRGQTWWKYAREFTGYLARCSYLYERGVPVSNVLCYLGDETDHKPDQRMPFPEGYKYDYCNPDALLNRISARDGKLVTPEGITYDILYLLDSRRMLPQTLEKLVTLARSGVKIAGNAPQGLATLSGGTESQSRFDAAVNELWGNKRVFTGSIGDALETLEIAPDVTGGDVLWLHRKAEGADWYYVAAPYGEGFKGSLSFRCTGAVERWDPLTGRISPLYARQDGERTLIDFDLARTESCFVVFDHVNRSQSAAPAPKPSVSEPLVLTQPWTLAFPSGWGAPASFQTSVLKAWKDLDMSPEARAFSGTVTYTTVFDAGKVKKNETYSLDLGQVEMIAAVTLNGKKLRTLWTPPYRLDITDALKSGKNTLQIEVTGTWFNRLAYDAGQPEEQRKTWTFNRPKKDVPLRESGLLGPVVLTAEF